MPQSLRGAYMQVSRSDLALGKYLQWLECTMLACDLVSIRLFKTMLNDYEHFKVRVDHEWEETDLKPNGLYVTRHILHLKLKSARTLLRSLQRHLDESLSFSCQVLFEQLVFWYRLAMGSQLEFLTLENVVFLSDLWLIHRRHMFTILRHAARFGPRKPEQAATFHRRKSSARRKCFFTVFLSYTITHLCVVIL